MSFNKFYGIMYINGWRVSFHRYCLIATTSMTCSLATKTFLNISSKSWRTNTDPIRELSPLCFVQIWRWKTTTIYHGVTNSCSENQTSTVRPMSHLQFYSAILLCNFIARQNLKCDIACRTLQLCRINENWPINVHSILATTLHRTEHY